MTINTYMQALPALVNSQTIVELSEVDLRLYIEGYGHLPSPDAAINRATLGRLIGCTVTL